VKAVKAPAEHFVSALPSAPAPIKPLRKRSKSKARKSGVSTRPFGSGIDWWREQPWSNRPVRGGAAAAWEALTKESVVGCDSPWRQPWLSPCSWRRPRRRPSSRPRSSARRTAGTPG